VLADWLIIDGNNLVHSGRARSPRGRALDFDSERWALARRLDELAGDLADRVTVVFDGKYAGRNAAFDASAVEVLFTAGETTADARIERLVASSPHPARITVVTSDRGETLTVEAAGAGTMSCAIFLDHIEERRAALDDQIRRRRSRAGPATLGDFFPRREEGG